MRKPSPISCIRFGLRRNLKAFAVKRSTRPLRV
jgi:hypothetical protein